MAQQTWDLYVDGNRHVVELEHGYWSGRRIIRVDGNEVVNHRQFNDRGSKHPVQIGSREAVVTIRTNGFIFRYDLVVDGVSQTTNEKVDLQQPMFHAYWGKRPPKWLGGHLSPLEDQLLATAVVVGALGFWYMTLPPLPLKVLGGVVLAVGVVVPYFVRQRKTFLIMGLCALAAGVIPMLMYPRAWKAFIFLPAIIGFRAFSFYRKNPSSKRPTGR